MGKSGRIRVDLTKQAEVYARLGLYNDFSDYVKSLVVQDLDSKQEARF